MHFIILNLSAALKISSKLKYFFKGLINFILKKLSLFFKISNLIKLNLRILVKICQMVEISLEYNIVEGSYKMLS